MEKRYVSIDIETTGLDPSKHQILEIGAIIEDWVSPIDTLPMFHCYIKYPTIIGDPYALDMNSDILHVLANPDRYPDCRVIGPGVVASYFYNWLKLYDIDTDCVVAAGKNFANFDKRFLENLPGWDRFITFYHKILDPGMLYWIPGVDGSKLPSQQECLIRADMNKKVEHRALTDAIQVVKLIRKYYEKC